MQIEASEQYCDMHEYSDSQKLYHSVLIIEAGLVHGVVILSQDGQPLCTRINRLTWSGHEFLEITRDGVIWNKAKRIVAESAKGAAIEIVTSACKKLLSLGIEATVRGLTQPRG
jgi:hypothetical protein